MTKELPTERGKTIRESGHSMCKAPRTETGTASSRNSSGPGWPWCREGGEAGGEPPYRRPGEGVRPYLYNMTGRFLAGRVTRRKKSAQALYQGAALQDEAIADYRTSPPGQGSSWSTHEAR